MSNLKWHILCDRPTNILSVPYFPVKNHDSEKKNEVWIELNCPSFFFSEVGNLIWNSLYTGSEPLIAVLNHSLVTFIHTVRQLTPSKQTQVRFMPISTVYSLVSAHLGLLIWTQISSSAHDRAALSSDDLRSSDPQQKAHDYCWCFPLSTDWI